MKKTLFFTALALFASCELIVDVDIPLEHQQMTLNSFFTPDSVWTASVTLNRHVLDDADFKKVDDALLVVYSEGTPIDTLAYTEDGIYRSDNGKPVAGRSYQLTASSPSWGSASASSYLPVPVPVTSFEVAEGESAPNEPPKLVVKVSFQDRSDEVNYYEAILMVETRFVNPTTGQGFVNRSPIRLSSNDPSMNSEDMENTEGIFFKDILFSGKQQTFTFDAEYWGGYMPSPNRTVKFFFYLRTLSEDFYRYKTTLLLQNHVDGDPFAQPVMVYENVENGFGIFGGYSQTEFVFEP